MGMIHALFAIAGMAIVAASIGIALMISEWLIAKVWSKHNENENDTIPTLLAGDVRRDR